MENNDNFCPFCGNEFSSEHGLNAQEHLAKGILAKYRELQNKRDSEDVLPCPRCGKSMNPTLEHNSISCCEDIYICTDCSTEDTAESASGKELSITEWFIVCEILAFAYENKHNMILVK